MIERMEEGKWRRRRLERVLLPYMGICTARLVVGSKTWSSFFRKRSTTQPQVRCITSFFLQGYVRFKPIVWFRGINASNCNSKVWIPTAVDWTYSCWQRMEELLNLEHGDKGDERCFQHRAENSWRGGEETQVGSVWSRERRWLPWGQEHTLAQTF